MVNHESLAAFRDRFPVVERMAYFASGSVGPASTVVLDAARTWQQAWAEDPQPTYRAYHAEREKLREAVAGLLGANPDEIAITESASRGAQAAVRFLADRAGDHVVVDQNTYPSSRYPWLSSSDKHLVHVSYHGRDRTDAVLDAVTSLTTAVSISHVDWVTGIRHDLARLARGAHDHGALLLVDASQSVGVVDLDVHSSDVDVLVGTFGKWLLGGPGLGFLYMRRDLVDGPGPLDPGWKNLAPEGTDWPTESLPEFVSTARRFEPWTPNLSSLVMATAGVGLITRTGIRGIVTAVGELTGRVIRGLRDLDIAPLTPEDPEQRAGLVAFRHARAPELARRLRASGVEITGYEFGLVRIDPHAFNTGAEVDLLLDELGSAITDSR